MAPCRFALAGRKSMKSRNELGAKGANLLAVLVAEIRRGRFRPNEPETFLGNGEALDKLGVARRGRSGQQLQREGLNELNEWTRIQHAVPKIAGLIVDKKKSRPGPGFAPSLGRNEADWKTWWPAETARAIAFDWSPYLDIRYPGPADTETVVREGSDSLDYRKIITIEPGKRGGRPCIRRMRITVGDVLGWLAAGMSHAEIFEDFPEITEDDIRACLAFAAEKENHAVSETA
jgi:uncharacterized protein (DUF433 family)